MLRPILQNEVAVKHSKRKTYSLPAYLIHINSNYPFMSYSLMHTEISTNGWSFNFLWGGLCFFLMFFSWTHGLKLCGKFSPLSKQAAFTWTPTRLSDTRGAVVVIPQTLKWGAGSLAYLPTPPKFNMEPEVMMVSKFGISCSRGWFSGEPC